MLFLAFKYRIFLPGDSIFGFLMGLSVVGFSSTDALIVFLKTFSSYLSFILYRFTGSVMVLDSYANC